MRKLFIATTLFTALGGGCAVAADMAVKAAPMAVRSTCAQFGGFYIGVQGGSVLHDSTWSDRNSWAKNEADLALPSSVTSNEFSWHVGPQAGWNWQSGCTVFGVMADWSWSGNKNTTINTDGQPGAALDTLAVTSEVEWFGTARTRAGVVVDNLLLYVSGGAAFAKINYTASLTNFIGGAFQTERFSSDKTRFGWAAGVGTEWAFAPNWTFMSEIVFIGFPDKSETFSSGFAVLNGNPPNKTFDYKDTLWVGRFGLNYRW